MGEILTSTFDWDWISSVWKTWVSSSYACGNRRWCDSSVSCIGCPDACASTSTWYLDFEALPDFFPFDEGSGMSSSVARTPRLVFLGWVTGLASCPMGIENEVFGGMWKQKWIEWKWNVVLVWWKSMSQPVFPPRLNILTCHAVVYQFVHYCYWIIASSAFPLKHLKVCPEMNAFYHIDATCFTFRSSPWINNRHQEPPPPAMESPVCSVVKANLTDDLVVYL